MEDNLKKEIEELLSSFREMVAEEHEHFKVMVEDYSYCKCNDIIRRALELDEDELC